MSGWCSGFDPRYQLTNKAGLRHEAGLFICAILPSMTSDTLSAMLSRAKLNDSSFRAMAKDLGMSHETLRRYFQGVSAPPKPVLRRLCQYFEIDYETAERLAQQQRTEANYLRKSLEDEKFRLLGSIWQLMDLRERDALLGEAVAVYNRFHTKKAS